MKLNIKFLTLFLPVFIYAAGVTSAYNGSTGIFETPNARIMPDWNMRFFYNEDEPYTYFGLTLTPLPFLETNFHITKLDGINGFDNGKSYGSYKDKAVNFKLLLHEETKYLPSVVFGAEDFWGTALYSSKYLAFSKEIGYFDFTLGYAKGRLGGEDLRKYSVSGTNTGSSTNSGFNFLKSTEWTGGKPFGNVVFKAMPNLFLMAEYSPINYSKDKVNPFLSGKKYELPSSDFNFGLKYFWSDNSIFSLSFQRGNTVSFGYTYQFGYDRTGMFDHLPDPKWKADDKKKKEYQNLTEKELSDKLSNEVAAEKFENVQTSVNENKIWSEISNPRYYHDLKAVGRAISTIDEVAPEKYDTIYLTLKNKYTPIKTFKVNRKEFDLFENEKLSDDYMKKAIVISGEVEDKYKEFSDNKKDIYKTNLFNTKRFDWDYGLKARTYLNHPDKPFALKISARVNASYDITDKLTLTGAVEQPLYNDGKDLTVDKLEDESQSLRSDSTLTFTYNNTQIPYLSAYYVDRIFGDSFYKIEAGLLEYAFAGTDIEWYKPMFDDRFGIGLQYQKVYKRQYDKLFGIKDDYSYDAKFVNIFYQAVPKYNINVGLKIGQFLAGDKGVRVDVSRNYKGFTVGAFATVTNSNEVFTNSENKGYIDKGIYMKIPLEVFTFKNLKRRVSYGIKPWSRDVGQYSGTLYSLYPLNNSENNTQIMKDNINYLKY